MSGRKKAPPAPNEPERTLPNNLEAERAVIGAILLRNEVFDSVAKLISAPSFFRGAHQFVYKVMTQLLEKASGAVDVVMLKDALAKQGLLEEVGGPSYIATFTDGVPRSINAMHYAGIVREKALYRHLITAGERLMADAYAEEKAADVVMSDAERILMELQSGHEGQVATLASMTPRLMENLEYRVKHRGELTGPTTGFKSIDDETMGWQAGDLIVLAARPSIGKTTFAINSVVESAKRGTRVLFYSMEMTKEQLELRILAGLSGVPLKRIAGGYVLDAEWPQLAAAIEVMHELPISIDDTPGRTAWQIRSGAKRLKVETGVELVVIDYVQLMPGTLERKGVTRNEEVTDISRKLKIMAGELSVAVILLSQLNRAAEGRSDPRPKLSDLRDSGALEQDADLVCFLHRKNHREGGVTNFILEKQRNGPTGTVNLTLDRDITLFVDGGEEPAPKPPTPEETEEQKRKHFQRKNRRQG